VSAASVCAFQSLSQENNWLISQFINKTEGQRDVFIKVVPVFY